MEYEMGLSDTERLVLYRLHENLALNAGGRENSHTRAMRVLEHGLEDAFPERIWPNKSPQFDKAVALFVRDVVTLYDKLQYSVFQSKLSQKNLIRESETFFRGFCKKSEAAYFELADVMVNKVGGMHGFRISGDLDSGKPMKKVYERMIEASKSCVWNDGAGFSTNDLLKIFRAEHSKPTTNDAAHLESENPKTKNTGSVEVRPSDEAVVEAISQNTN